MAELYGPTIEDAKGRLDLDLAPGISIRADRQLLAQAIANLMDNAIKYGCAPGSNEGPSVTLRLAGEGDKAVITVADHGPGIPDEQREHAKERFVRLDQSRSQAGNGLGLSLVGGIMKLHGGRFELDDNHPGLVARLVFDRLEFERRVSLPRDGARVIPSPGGMIYHGGMRGPLDQRIGDIPPALDRPAVELALARLREVGGDDAGPAAHAIADLAEGDGPAGRLIDAVLGGSPFLADLIIRDPVFALTCLRRSPEEVTGGISRELADIALSGDDERTVKKRLRQARNQAALAIALADIAGAWDLMTVCGALTRFADAALGSGLEWLLREAGRAGRLTLDDANPGKESGYVVFAMGKQGAFELNYSSDIDLIVLYDPERAPLAASEEPATFFVRLTRRLVGLMQDVTEDGYVFRVDLRLRPDPRATQIAIAYEAAANYYEYMGQNWERAAMIKARPVAGDMALGEEFLARLVPYKWRKYLDFAAIADVQSLKRQIHAVKGHGTIAVRGHNVKLGRGGIREIEFFVQTQQLIAGGRNPSLRGRGTLAMLDALAAAQWIAAEAACELKEAYCLPAHGREPHPDDGRPADPRIAGRRGNLRRARPLLRLSIGR